MSHADTPDRAAADATAATANNVDTMNFAESTFMAFISLRRAVRVLI